MSTATDEQILDVARRWWREPGACQQRIADELNTSHVAFLIRLNRLLDDPRMLAEHPTIVARWRRLRDQAMERRLRG